MKTFIVSFSSHMSQHQNYLSLQNDSIAYGMELRLISY